MTQEWYDVKQNVHPRHDFGERHLYSLFSKSYGLNTSDDEWSVSIYFRNRRSALHVRGHTSVSAVINPVELLTYHVFQLNSRDDITNRT